MSQALAVAGLAVVGRDYYGVYPLRGKPLNARDAPIKQILANKELQDLVAALGLDFTKTYETVCFPPCCSALVTVELPSSHLLLRATATD